MSTLFIISLIMATFIITVKIEHTKTWVRIMTQERTKNENN